MKNPTTKETERDRKFTAQLMVRCLMKGWTQPELADLCRVEKKTVQQWSKGTRKAPAAHRDVIRQCSELKRFSHQAKQLLRSSRNCLWLFLEETRTELYEAEKPVDPRKWKNALAEEAWRAKWIVKLERSIRDAERRWTRLGKALGRAKPEGLQLVEPPVRPFVVTDFDFDDPRSGAFGRKDEL